ncbi:hypothetical protein SLEP1_g5584 [Rubroshorea leprosula]|uniref:Uncharacterized protein n=1 Tax=Rubroshorea leprosula TaxID=152421 RepID=A0AAV5HSQ1_9ROSI|nr:hypothetical protein SLEP1_g5584 [Rubroshorea leprosula]
MHSQAEARLDLYQRYIGTYDLLPALNCFSNLVEVML